MKTIDFHNPSCVRTWNVVSYSAAFTGNYE